MRWALMWVGIILALAGDLIAQTVQDDYLP